MRLVECDQLATQASFLGFAAMILLAVVAASTMARRKISGKAPKMRRSRFLRFSLTIALLHWRRVLRGRRQDEHEGIEAERRGASA
ncbi:hypothetical protein VAPA_1c44390 [Variovorax paradoxus B4]|uniref:Transmembrane protein n=1 Tax=Variovorax paradoxus B4 TaxID=1246301 RepID=T1XF01_VARPD|nr:hypothetical protein VAPA_1c44390 [Variovorax paradoxus B4]